MGTEADDFDDVLGRARSGDETAFLRLWDHLHPRLLRYLRVIGCDEADDVASETWLQAIRDLSRFAGGADDFRGWLFGIGRHRAIDASRARIRSRRRLLTAALSSTGLDTAAVADMLGKSQGAVRIALHRGLRTLSADPRVRALEEVDQ